MLCFHHEDENSDPFMAGEFQFGYERNFYYGLVYFWQKKIRGKYTLNSISNTFTGTDWNDGANRSTEPNINGMHEYIRW